MTNFGTKSRIIPIKLVTDGADDSMDTTHDRLIREGWMQMMSMGDPGLAQLVERYEGRGYEVWVEVHNTDDATDQASQPRFGTLYIRKPLAAGSKPV